VDRRKGSHHSEAMVSSAGLTREGVEKVVVVVVEMGEFQTWVEAAVQPKTSPWEAETCTGILYS
jgi:hypothetical protein